MRPVQVSELVVSTPLDLRVPLVDGLPPLQRRWTISLRLLLAIPQFFVLFFVGIGAFFVAIFTWFVALFTGRPPEAAAAMLRRYIRWATRVGGYIFLFTDVYPPFNGEADLNYPIEVEFPPTPDLNRAAVLFRVVLMYPVFFFSTLLSTGLSVFIFFFWIAALVLGRLPDPVYRAGVTVFRYQTRLNGFALMVTSEYPWGWRGDKTSTSATTVPSQPISQDYWAANSEEPSTTGLLIEPVITTMSFDYRITGWAEGWLWIYLVLGVLEHLRSGREFFL
jgi:hypothetical protein